MLNKKIIFLAIILVSLLAVSAVSAAENIAEGIVGANATDEVVSVETPADDSVGVENQDDGLSEDVSDVLGASPKSFKDLNKLINGNNQKDVYLDGNYAYKGLTDLMYKKGISVDRVVTVHGNGFTISGENAARIFRVTNSGVVFCDIVFENGKASDYGGAIDGQCSVVNCTFNNNRAYYGGAMNGGSAVNCTFNDNYANTFGGAINEGSAVNCTFNNNQAYSYGAMDGGSAVNCTFNGNYAEYYGGAARSLVAVNCTFVSNYADECGGAMVEGSATNCVFIGNYAGDYGGAIEGGTAVNCTFIDNSAGDSGGALFYCSAANCSFVGNHAYDGGAIWGDGNVASNCIFINNSAHNGGAIYQIIANNGIFTNNTASESGGAMFGGKARNCTFNHNNATDYGGAVYDAKVSSNSLFCNNSAKYGDDYYNVRFFNYTGIKTFTDLNKLINGNNERDVYLDGDYAFDFVTDADFKNGINIGRAVTVHGNGFTISGENAARIFSVSNSGAVFCDVVFENAETADNGGAIDGYCTVENCTFNENSAEYGGAMNDGYAVNCTFNYNSAGSSGGAMIYGYAVNCTFNYNSAIGGGALKDCSAWNCTFNNNHGHDYGAMSGGYAENCNFSGNFAKGDGGAAGALVAVYCTFVSNSANELGGALFVGIAVNCSFVGNHASGGGAIYSADKYEATNCSFINNSANNGGATYQVNANNCTFTNNTASESGGAMFGGSASNCIFKDNADVNGSAFSGVTFPKAILSVSDFSTLTHSNEILATNLTDISGVPINNADIKIMLYKNNTSVGTYYCLSGDGWVVSLDAGIYTAVFSVENPVYDVSPANATLTVERDFSKISASDITTVYNGGKYVVANLVDGDNKPISGVNVSVRFSNGEVINSKTDNDGNVKFTTDALAPKTSYSATITFEGNINYLKSTKSVKVTVKKATPKLTAAKKTFKKSTKTKKYTITLKTNRNKVMKNTKVTLKVNGKTYAAKTNSKGQATFKITKMTKKGKYTAVVTYAGSKYYNANTVKPKITVK